MSNPPDPRVLFAAERTLLAWQRSSMALMGFGFVIERFSLFLSALRHEPENPGHHLFSLLVGVALNPARCWRRACIKHQLSTIRQDLAEPGRIIGLLDRSGFSYQRSRRRSGNRIGGLSARGGSLRDTALEPSVRGAVIERGAATLLSSQIARKPSFTAKPYLRGAAEPLRDL